MLIWVSIDNIQGTPNDRTIRMKTSMNANKTFFPINFDFCLPAIIICFSWHTDINSSFHPLSITTNIHWMMSAGKFHINTFKLLNYISQLLIQVIYPNYISQLNRSHTSIIYLKGMHLSNTSIAYLNYL